MTVALDGSGGLLTRLGALYRWLKENRLTVAGNAAAGQWPYELADLYEEYAGAANEVQAAIEAIQQGMTTSASSVEQLNSSLQLAAQNTLIEMVDADDPLPARNVTEAFRVLVEQMIANSESVASNTVTVSVTAGGSNTGDGFLIADNLDRYGHKLECALAEDLICERDPDLQQFLVRGEAAAASRLSSYWPLGSGITQRVSATNAQTNQGYLVNGSFEAITANVPDAPWELIVGTAGTHIKEETVTILAGTKALEFDGDGSNLTNIRQAITASVSARTPFFVGCFLKVDVVPAGGVLTIDLHDGTSVIQDDAGNNQSFTVTLSTLTTSWLGVGRLFRIADPKPAAVYLRVRLSTALSSGSSLFIDNLTAGAAVESYAGGPFAGCVAGAVEFARDDVHVINVANNRSSVYQEACEVFFDTPALGRKLPTSGSPTITNSLPIY